METQNKSHYVFRICYEEPYYGLLKKSIQHGVLRQGWGMQKPGLSSMGVSKDSGHFISAWRENFEDDGATEKSMKTKYNQLKIMLEFKVGDTLVVPKVPDGHEFWVLEVTEPYSFQKE